MYSYLGDLAATFNGEILMLHCQEKKGKSAIIDKRVEKHINKQKRA